MRIRKIHIVLLIIVILIIIRLILPGIILHYTNKTLQTMPGYYGHVQDIDLAIYRGAYRLKNIYLDKIDSVSGVSTPFFSSRLIDLSVEWKALFHGKIVGELAFDDPLLRFTKDKAEPAQVTKDTTDFRKLLRSFMPLKVNRFEVFRGTIQFIDSTTKPVVNIRMNETHILAQNLKNVHDTALLPATVNASALVYGGTLNFDMKLDPLAEQSTFDMNAEIKNTNLPELNDFFKAYGKFDVSKGNFGLYTEIAAKEGKFKGYVKPLIKDLKVLGEEDRHDNILQKTWEGIVGTASHILRNHKQNQVATKIPFEGSLNNMTSNPWYAIVDLLRNAFIQALLPSIDYEINIQSITPVKEEKKGFLKKLFAKHKAEKKELPSKDMAKNK
jgi:hypothetical protein